MSELDEIWSRMIAEAGENAKASGRGDVADYLSLRASNDALRKAGVDWLFETLIESAAAINRNGSSVHIERTEPHSFRYRGANIVGVSLSFRFGVRSLTVEAGWTRTPADGFMRGGAFAFARFRHFGIAEANLEAGLFNTAAAPVWKALNEDQVGNEIHSRHLERHIAVLVGE